MFEIFVFSTILTFSSMFLKENNPLMCFLISKIILTEL